MLIDQHLPEYHFVSAHSIEISADGRDVFDAARHGDFSNSAMIRRLFRLRGLPRSALSVDGLLGLGFVLLAEQSGREFVLGAVGKPWTPGGKLLRLDGAGYAAFDTAGYAKIAWNFTVDRPPAAPLRLSTETRVQCTDNASRRKFALYWRLAGPLSGWIRRAMLLGIKQRLEHAVSFKETL